MERLDAARPSENGAPREKKPPTHAHIRGGHDNTATGRSSGFRIILLAAPSPRNTREWHLRRSSPITAAGPRWLLTTFPETSLRERPGPRNIYLSRRSEINSPSECEGFYWKWGERVKREEDRSGEKENLDLSRSGARARSAFRHVIPMAPIKMGRVDSPRRDPHCFLKQQPAGRSPSWKPSPLSRRCGSSTGLPQQAATAAVATATIQLITRCVPIVGIRSTLRKPHSYKIINSMHLRVPAPRS